MAVFDSGAKVMVVKTVAPTFFDRVGSIESTKGTRGSPLICRCVLFFIIEGRPVVVFGSRDPLPLFWRPPFGVKSKRIFLSADLLLRIDPTSG